MKNPASKGNYVYVGGKRYDARTSKARDAIRRDGRSFVPVSRWDGYEWKDTGTVLYPSEGPTVSPSHKTPPAQLRREIDAVLSKKPNSAHATRKVRAPRVALYRIQLTPDELRAVEFARGRYAWPDMLSAYAADDGTIAFTESEMWQWVDDVDSDDAPFPLAAPALASKLQRFYDSRV